VVDAELLQDCAVLGLELDRLVDPAKQPQPLDYALWPEHAVAWRVFVACESQWCLVLGMAGALYTGLNYSGLDVVRKAHRIDDAAWGEVLEQVQVLERCSKALRNRSAQPT
jgi:Phage related hypothetical protein (DUF1799)